MNTTQRQQLVTSAVRNGKLETVRFGFGFDCPANRQQAERHFAGCDSVRHWTFPLHAQNLAKRIARMA